jgi:hypothetical protein
VRTDESGTAGDEVMGHIWGQLSKTPAVIQFGKPVRGIPGTSFSAFW